MIEINFDELELIDFTPIPIDFVLTPIDFTPMPFSLEPDFELVFGLPFDDDQNEVEHGA
jgi:hypothetical protein